VFGRKREIGRRRKAKERRKKERGKKKRKIRKKKKSSVREVGGGGVLTELGFCPLFYFILFFAFLLSSFARDKVSQG
jgi:hypothetical protein